MEPDIAIINIKNLKERMNREYRKEFYGYIGDIDIINKTIDTLLEERQQDKEKIKELEQKLDETLNANLELIQGNANSIPVSLVEEKLNKEKLLNIIVGGRRNATALKYGKKLGRIEICEELLEKRK